MLKLYPIPKFKDDHRKVRDTLFELIEAISRRYRDIWCPIKWILKVYR
jgi:hypothetical protein